ncbi:hypothetical protein VCCP1035_1803A, partial [Vibrio cholerae CP1035(8)]
MYRRLRHTPILAAR